MMGRSEQARQSAARADIASIKTALDAYEVDNGSYPKALADLLQAPRQARNWRGPYLDKIPQDPWGNEYQFAQPGRQNANSFDLSSIGPDGKAGTEDDFGNWTAK
jgi:general secretion pathway protein G